jgi:hypothetical protein
MGQYFARVDATMAKIQAMDDGFENRAAAREKALADKANEREWAAAQEKAWAEELRQMAARENALADETDELHQAAALDKILADEATKQCRADTLKKALADEAYKRHQAATRQKVLANEVNKRRCRPSTTVDGKPQKACRRSRPNYVLVAAMAPEPPIHRSTFFVVGDIGHELPTNLLGMDGPKRWWDSFASCSLKALFGRQFS